jgi:HlyD family secretion protein
MTRHRLALLLVLPLLSGCHPDAPAAFQGWVEAETMFIGPEDTGRVVQLGVAEGQDVKTGDFLFAIDPAVQMADLDAAKASLQQASARLARVENQQQRPEEIAVLEASQRQMKAALDFSDTELARVRALSDRSVASRQQLDQAQSNADRDRAALENVTRQIEVAHLSGRTEDIDAARFVVDQAKAQVTSAQARVDRTRVYATASGRVQEIYFRPGEVVAAGKPVVSVLPPGQVKLRFFVGEALLPSMRLGGTVNVACDRCGGDLHATVSFISQSAEFTPPVIYSLEERQKLVYKIEARPADPDRLRVGQPVTVRLP